MLKTITKSTMFSMFVFGLMTVLNQIVFAASKCTVNGREVPCEELGNQIKRFLGWGIGGIFIVLAFLIWAMVFWVMMIIHTVQHNVENKAMWIILMVFTGIVGALIYYFVVKRKFNKQFIPPTPTMPR